MNQTNHLPEGTLLRGGIYKIIRFISSGGFGCTYEALDTSMGISVCLKEFFVGQFCNREADGKTVTVGTRSQTEMVEKLRSKFKDEALRIYSLKHGGVVRVSAVFDENGTSYYAMDFIRGKSLQSIIDERGALPEYEALGYMRQVCEAMSYVHARNILHLDIKPANIMVDAESNAVLIDFGVSKQYDEVNGQNTSTLLGFSAGYAPPEQMCNQVRSLDPATDIYSLGATLYTLLTGKTPPVSSGRISGDDLEPLPATVNASTRAAVERAMALNRKERPQTVDDFLALLGGQGAPPKKPNSSKRPEPISGQTVIVNHDASIGKGSNRRWLWVAIAIGVIFGLALFFLTKGEKKSPTIDAAVPADTTQVTPDTAAVSPQEIAQQLPVNPDTPAKPEPAKQESQQPTAQQQSAGSVVQQPTQVQQPVQQVQQQPTQQQPVQSASSGYTNGHEWVDMGTSVKWATTNVGASSPSGYGDYFAWGETSKKAEYRADNSATLYKDISRIAGNPTYDVARAKWGSNWRMPTQAEFQELINNCEWKWTGAGMTVTAKNGNSIFFPAAGDRFGTSLDHAGEDVEYWSSSSSESHKAFYLYCSSSGCKFLISMWRTFGLPVRPVRE